MLICPILFRCDYEDNGKGLHIDVDKILDSTKEEVRFIQFIDGYSLTSLYFVENFRLALIPMIMYLTGSLKLKT